MEHKNFTTHPSKMILIVFTMLLSFSNGLMLWASFNDNGDFEVPNPVTIFLMLYSLYTLGSLYINYFKNTIKESKTS